MVNTANAISVIVSDDERDHPQQLKQNDKKRSRPNSQLPKKKRMKFQVNNNGTKAATTSFVEIPKTKVVPANKEEVVVQKNNYSFGRIFSSDNTASSSKASLRGIYYDDIELSKCTNVSSLFMGPPPLLHRHHSPGPLRLKQIPFHPVDRNALTTWINDAAKQKRSTSLLTHYVHTPLTTTTKSVHRDCTSNTSETKFKDANTNSIAASLLDAAVVLSTQLPCSVPRRSPI